MITKECMKINDEMKKAVVARVSIRGRVRERRENFNERRLDLRMSKVQAVLEDEVRSLRCNGLCRTMLKFIS